MMIRTTCPTDDELRSFGTGRLSGDAVEQVAEHVEGCTDCESRLASFDAEPDRIVSGLLACAPSARDETIFAVI